MSTDSGASPHGRAALPRWSWLGRVPYRQALERQRSHRESLIAGSVGPVLWLLEHPPVVTEGRRSTTPAAAAEHLSRLGIDWLRTERGGLATYHGPGQLVGYLICDMAALGLGPRRTVRALERGLMDWLGTRGLQARRRPEYPGVWVQQAKIAALGLHFRRGVSMHGFALNLTLDLAPYGLIVPCGITDGEVTSLERLNAAGATPPERAAAGVADAVIRALAREAGLAPPMNRA